MSAGANVSACGVAHAYRFPTTYPLDAGLIRTLRVVVIGKILLDAISLAAAIISGGASAAVSVLVRTGASAAINVIIDQTINELLGGGQ
ncbi:hypothetical protein HMPREF1531_00969 [Propionibacterium sp. oral taxon 192 str. F0372]|uniref:hypothetical protein n=1 Tax=Propionibacterium sp. oral taxon 192 TaxID=671222 RepID=UPI000352FC2A|nr:hypothetical protein [Propionibacterium sp. oral taxon 192]EPH05540.1 hypothetical protein HMPREF1531_00969 [Propionibacterium sp. oral taxon 192 str. F0372]